ncbi:hypothetical protein KCU85_g208, partial [Aureobasidium melanogenum]
MLNTRCRSLHSQLRSGRTAGGEVGDFLIQNAPSRFQAAEVDRVLLWARSSLSNLTGDFTSEASSVREGGTIASRTDKSFKLPLVIVWPQTRELSSFGMLGVCEQIYDPEAWVVTAALVFIYSGMTRGSILAIRRRSWVKLAISEFGGYGKVQLFRLGHVARKVLSPDDTLGIVEVAHMVGQDGDNPGDTKFDHVELLTVGG